MLISLNLETFLEFFTFDIKEMKVEFMESGIIARAALEVRTKWKNVLPITKLKTRSQLITTHKYELTIY